MEGRVRAGSWRALTALALRIVSMNRLGCYSSLSSSKTRHPIEDEDDDEDEDERSVHIKSSARASPTLRPASRR